MGESTKNKSQLNIQHKWERRMIWAEKFYGEENEDEYVPPIFKSNKTNLPHNHPTPHPLKVFLNGVRSEIQDPLNRNNVKPNLSPEELNAVDELEKLQKDRKIMIKPCDKGAGVIILDFDECQYMQNC